MARRALNSDNCRVVWSVIRSMPASGSDEGASVSTSEKSIFRIDSGCTATLLSIDPAMPNRMKIQRKNTRNVPTTTARSPARKVFTKFIIRYFFVCIPFFFDTKIAIFYEKQIKFIVFR